MSTTTPVAKPSHIDPDTLLPCPFCGGTKIDVGQYLRRAVCDTCGASARIKVWQQRTPHSESREIPAELYDGMAVYVALGVEKTKDIRPQMVSDVLDAVVRLIRKNRYGEQSNG